MNRIDKKIGATPDDFHRYNFALAMIRELGEHAAKTIASGRVSIEMKPDGTPVTNIDKEIEERFIESVNKEYGDEDIVLGEETSDASAPLPESKRIWKLDPLDGTGWIQRLVEAGSVDYSELRALILASHFRPNETIPVFGISHSPFYGNDAKTISTINNSTYYYPGSGQIERQLRVSPDAPTDIHSVKHYEKNGLMGATQDVSEEQLERIMPLAKRIKLPLFMGNIALRNVDVSVFPGPSQPHDVAAGALAVVNAGGVVKDFDGHGFDQIDWRKYPINGVVAGSNESLVDQVIAHYTKR
jgi:3'-phosphoadenosine 5'-phosphosulfate (PAPS) 3'-phosphatase